MTLKAHRAGKAGLPRAGARGGAAAAVLAGAPLAALCLFSAPAWSGPAAGAQPAQTVSFNITAPAKKPKLAEPFKVVVEVSGAGGYVISVDTASIDRELFEITSIKNISPKRAAAGGGAGEFEFEARAFTIGVSTFPEINFRLSSAQGDLEARSPAFALEIEPLFEKSKNPANPDIRDIYPPLGFIPWLGIAAALAAACALAAFLVFRKKARAPLAGPQQAPDGRTPYRRALDNLAELEAGGLWEGGDIKGFYAGFSCILRRYIHERFSIDALLMTTAALSKELKKTGAGVQTQIKTRELLERSDLVKFAKFLPTRKDADLAGVREALEKLDGPCGDRTEKKEEAPRP